LSSKEDLSRKGEIIIEHADKWPVLRSDWQRLYSASEVETFFLSPIWVDAWLATYGDDHDLNFVCFRLGGALQGIVLISRRRAKDGLLSLEQLHLNTAGEGSDSPMVEHNAFVCIPEHQDTFAALLWYWLEEQIWDEFLFDGITRNSFTAIATIPGAPNEEIWRDAPYVDLHHLRCNGNSFLDSLSKNSRQKIRRSIRLYEEKAPIKLEYAPTKGVAITYFNELIQLHQPVWNSRGKLGAFASERMRTFHTKIIEAGQPRKDYDLIRISHGTETLGVIYNLIHANHISYYQSGFSYQSDNRLKPGLIGHSLVIQDALEAGFDEYDFLATADEGAQYKSSLSNANRQLGWITYRRHSMRASLIRAAKSIRRWLNRS